MSGDERPHTLRSAIPPTHPEVARAISLGFRALYQGVTATPVLDRALYAENWKGGAQ